MTTILVTLAGVLGALIGSFLNVVIYRLPRDKPIGMSRSECPACGKQIRWFDNIPIVSWLLLRARCRDCRAPIPFRYPLVEAVTAGLFALTTARVLELGWGWLGLGVALAFVSVLVALSFIDFDFKILPDTLTKRVGPLITILGAIGVPAIHGTALFGYELTPTVKPGMASLLVGVAGALVGGGVIAALRQLGTWAMKKEAMGLGDVKFMAMAGMLLGPTGALLAIGFSMVAGALFGILIWALTKNREIPFGPFLAAGSLAVVLYAGPIEVFVRVTYPAFMKGLIG